MDLHLSAHYVALAMELLLILSALLSAVTGAFSGVRGPETRAPQAQAAVAPQLAVAEEQAGRIAPTIPENALPAPEVPMLRDFEVAGAVPLYADRLIE